MREHIYYSPKLISEGKMYGEEVVLIKCTAEDIADYMKYRKDEAERSFFTMMIEDAVRPPSSETEEDYALGSFNEFIKYRYITSKLDKDLFDIHDKYFIADISEVNIAGMGLDLSGGDFSNVYAIGADLSFCKMYGADFKGAMLPLAKLKHAYLKNASFEKAILLEADVEHSFGVPKVEEANVDRLKGRFEKYEDHFPYSLISEIKSKIKSQEDNVTGFIEDNVDKIKEFGYEIASAIGSIRSIPTVMKCTLNGGAIGFTAANIILLVACPAVGWPIAINLSLVGTALGSAEGLSYAINSDRSFIVKIKNKFKLDSFIKGMEKVNKDGMDYIKFDDDDGVCVIDDLMKIVADHKALPVLDLKKILFEEVKMADEIEQEIVEEIEDSYVFVEEQEVQPAPVVAPPLNIDAL
jgi:hypothetical protein